VQAIFSAPFQLPFSGLSLSASPFVGRIRAGERPRMRPADLPERIKAADGRASGSGADGGGERARHGPVRLVAPAPSRLLQTPGSSLGRFPYETVISCLLN